MNKYFYFFKTNKNGMILSEQCQWIDVAECAKNRLGIDRCEIYVYSDTEKFEDRLENPPIKKEKAGYFINKIDKIKHDNFKYTLNINDYLKYIRKYDDAFVYFDNNENPRLYRADELVISTISHENYIEFFITETEKDLIEKELEIQLTPKDIEPKSA